ncbi:uncharacterized protein LOC122252642 [Penaeus japonicus]|uniref:uncharacterized protein LOC122252642 n=1 Tax=Penaeus japonicus TaxID=27405 RepID=UPI001C70F7AD|nr:uncharacterized protein LOC122252642 [Penaeus japonicus]
MIKDTLHEIIPGVTVTTVCAKWRKLKFDFIKYEDNKKLTGRSRMREPKHYDLLASFLLERPIVNPCVTEEGIHEEPEIVDAPVITQVPITATPAMEIPPRPQGTTRTRRRLRPATGRDQLVSEIRQMRQELREKFEFLKNAREQEANIRKDLYHEQIKLLKHLNRKNEEED